MLIKNVDPSLLVFKEKNIYHEVFRGSSSLIITVGDSWTWGESLGDDLTRTKQIYGNHITEEFKSDWINVGVSAGSNSLIISKFFDVILSQLEMQYEEILVILTLTELGRELNYPNNLFNEDIVTPWTLNSFLEKYEYGMFKYIQDRLSNSNVKFLIGRNFTYTYENNLKEFSNVLIDKIWIDTIAEYTGHYDYPLKTKFISQLAQGPLLKFLKEHNVLNDSKLELSDMMIDSLDAVDWLFNSPLNYNYGTGHPNAQGHKLWADYLIKQIKEKFQHN